MGEFLSKSSPKEVAYLEEELYWFLYYIGIDANTAKEYTKSIKNASTYEHYSG